MPNSTYNKSRQTAAMQQSYQQQQHDMLLSAVSAAAAAPDAPAYSPFAGSAQGSGFLPPTPPRGPHPQHTPQAAQSLGLLGSSHSFGATRSPHQGNRQMLPSTPPGALQGGDTAGDYGDFGFGGFGSRTAAAGGGGAGAGGLGSLSRAGSSSYGMGVAGGSFGGSAAGTGFAGTPSSTGPSSPSLLPPAIAAAELLRGGSGSAVSMGHQFPGMMQQGRPASSGSWGYAGGADALNPPGLHASYHGSPLSRSATLTMQQLLQQQHHHQQQAAMGRSFSLDADIMAAAQAAAAGGGRWGRMPQDVAAGGGGYGDQGRLFGAVYDMKSLTAALSHVQAGTGDVRRMLASCTFRPRLPGLTKLVSQMSREGHWAKALEVYEALNAVGVRPDTTITNAAISACDKGGQWEKALQLFRAMPEMGMERDAITYSALISALSKGRQWSMAIDVFNHMVAEGVECDAVTCCSLITALDKGGQWQLAEQVFIQMYQSHTQFHVLLEGMQQETPGSSAIGSPSPLAGTFTAAALSALSIQEDQLPPAEQIASLAPPGLQQDPDAAAAAGGNGDGGGGDAASGGELQPGTAAAVGLRPLCNASPGGLAASISGMLGQPESSFPGQPGSSSPDALPSGLLSGQPGSEFSGERPDSRLPDELQPDSQDSGIVRTLSGAWSKVVGARAASGAAAANPSNAAGVAAAAAAAVSAADSAAHGNVYQSSSTASSSSSCSASAGWDGSSGECLLASSDAVVLLPDAAAGKPAGGKQQHSSPNSVLTRSLSSQLLEVGIFPPGSRRSPTPGKDGSATADQSAFAEPAAAAAADSAAAAAAAAAAAPGLTSPSRPPMHPVRKGYLGGPTTAADVLAAAAAGQPAGSSSSRQQSLQRAGSLGAAPVGTVGLRLGRAGSLNSKKSSPNRVCCNALLAAYARAVPPRWKQSLRLLDVMWQCGGELVPDIVSYNTVMKACGNAQQTDMAFQLYHHMQQRGIEPTVATYGTLITIASEAQAYGRVKESWGWLQASGLPVHITCVNSYLTALIKEDNWDAAVDLFNQLKANQLGVRPNSVTYNILMSACLSQDKPQQVKALFDEMTTSSLSPSLISYNTLLHAYAKMGAWQESLALLQHLCSSSAVRPSTTSFNTVFCTLSNVAAAVGELDKHTICSRALEVYALMLDQPGVVADTTLYRNMVSTFAACHAHSMVLQLMLLMAQQGHSLDPGTAAAALDALQVEGSWQLAGQLLRACYGAGTVVSQLVIQQLLLACAEQGAWKAAREVLQVSASAGQLDGVAQLLQQYRSQLQAAHASSQGLGLIRPDTLDELLFLTFLQGQFASRGWVQALELNNQLKADRGPTFASGNAGVTSALFDLLVVSGGTEGLLAALQVADAAHASGAMGHYLLHPRLSAPASTNQGGSPSSSPLQPGLNSGLLSPQQQMILQLEQLSGGSPAGDLTGALGSLGIRDEHGLNPNMPEALSFLDVQGCSAIEGTVLLLSWLGHVVELQASGLQFQCECLRIFTGSWGAVDSVELQAIQLHTPATGAAPAATAAAAAAAVAGSGQEAPDTASGVGSTAESAATALEPAGEATSEHASASPGVTAAGEAPAGAAAAGGSAPGSSAAGGSASPATPVLTTASVHSAALAVLSGNLGPMMGCNSAMELLVPFSSAGRLGLGLLCCSAVPLLLPDDSQGGGVVLPVNELRAAIGAALDASRG